MDLNIKEENGYKYIDEGEGEIFLLLHGLFGALSNWHDVLNHYTKNYRIVIPMLPLYDNPPKETNIENLTAFIEKFCFFQKTKRCYYIR